MCKGRWPDVCEDAAEQAGQLAFDIVYRRLVVLGIAQARAQETAQRATERALHEASQRWAIPDYFSDCLAFRRWVAIVACREALRMAMLEPASSPWPEALGADERQLLMWKDCDGFTDTEIAQVLGISPHKARERV